MGIRGKVSRSTLADANNSILPAITIALLYKSRWQVALFFKWIKQHIDKLFIHDLRGTHLVCRLPL